MTEAVYPFLAFKYESAQELRPIVIRFKITEEKRRSVAAAVAALLVVIPASMLLHASPPADDDDDAGPSQKIPNLDQQITPFAPRGARFEPLNPNLKDHPEWLAGQAVTSVVSPDHRTLLVLTSGYNL